MRIAIKDNPSLAILCGTVALLLLIALFAPALAPNDPNQTDLPRALDGPSSQYPLGTDPLGRCMLSRILYGARVSIGSSLLIIAIVFCIGSAIGIAAGYLGGIVDFALTKLITVAQAFPKFILAIAIAGVLGIGIRNTILALCLVEWTEYARISRSLSRSIRQRTFIKAARVCGESHLKIMLHHVFPHILPTLVVNASLGISAMIMEVAALSYLGIGVESPMAEWGAMMNVGKEYLQTETRLVWIPGAAIFIASILFNLFGDKIRDALTDKRYIGEQE